MSEVYYKEAQKLALKEYRSCVSRGLYPYLPVLDELLSDERIAQGADLGLEQIPAEWIVGTRTSGRTRSFARNFMPLIDTGTEFCNKWQALCRSHLEEGIRDPIKVYEYMNRYYVEEGNKRVSVLKFFHADTIYAQVNRIMPETTDSKEAQLYLELLDFRRCSGVNFIEFSKPGSCAKLQQFLGKEPGGIWSDSERSAFAAAYYYFRHAYESSGGRKLSSTVGDAMLAFIRVYGYQSLRGKPEAEIKKLVNKMWEEIALQQEQEPIDVKLSPEQKPGLLSVVFASGEGKGRKVAFIHDKDSLTSGWTKGHEQGREHVQRVFGDRIETVSYFNAMDNDPCAVIEQAIGEGCSTVFTTSPRLLPAALRSAVEHPKTVILNCSLNTSHRYIRTYYARMYEAKFVSGAVAGALAGSDSVGYLCDYPIFGQISGVNAFALGVQMVNPRAKVYLEWSCVDGPESAMRRLTDRGIRLISSQDLTKQGEESRASFGLSLISQGSRVTLAVPVWQWGVYYESMLRRIWNKSFQAEYEESAKALNYYWGMSAGVVQLHCSDTVPPSTRKMADLLQNSIREDLCHPFRGKLYTQAGEELDGDLTPEQIIRMDWLVENVEGSIPAYEQLSDIGKATVDQVGVDRAAKDGRAGP